METLTFGPRNSGEADNSFRGIFGEERDLAVRFITSPEFDSQRTMLQKAVLALSDPKQEDANFIESSIAGSIFEHIAIIHLTNLIEQKNLSTVRQKVLLSPDEVTEIYRRIYGADSIEYMYVLQRVIKGVTIPDGLEFTECPNTLQLTGIWEAKLGDLIDSNSNQRKSYRDGAVQRSLMLTSDDGRTRLRKIIREVMPCIPDKPVVASSNLKVASYLYPIGSVLPQMGYPGEKVPISRPTIQGLKEMFIRRETIDLNHKAA